MATWVSEASRAVPAAPVLMCPAVLHRRGASERDYTVSVDGEWTVNEALLQALAQHFDVNTSSEKLLSSYLEDARLDDDEVNDVFAALSGQAGGVPGFTIDGRQLLLGNFMYRKMPMVAEIQQNQAELAGNDLIAAIAGDTQALESLRAKRARKLDPAQPDSTPPADEYLTLDADSSQNTAINAAVAGESFVLQGPPGTGKSQTIANLIATMTARGRSVLFVAEKRAAIDAVCKRLTDVGLDQFVFDLHGGVVSRRRMAQHLDEALTKIHRTPPADHAELHSKLVKARDELSGYADELHKKREPWELSYFEMQMRLHTLNSQDQESAGGGSGESASDRVGGGVHGAAGGLGGGGMRGSAGGGSGESTSDRVGGGAAGASGLPVSQARAERRQPAGESARLPQPHQVALLDRLDREQADNVREWLRDWIDLAEPLLSGASPWTDADIRTGQEVREALDVLAKLRLAISEAREHMARLLSGLGSASSDGKPRDGSRASSQGARNGNRDPKHPSRQRYGASEELRIGSGTRGTSSDTPGIGSGTRGTSSDTLRIGSGTLSDYEDLLFLLQGVEETCSLFRGEGFPARPRCSDPRHRTREPGRHPQDQSPHHGWPLSNSQASSPQCLAVGYRFHA